MGDLDISLSGDDPGLGDASVCAAPSIAGSAEGRVVEHEPSFVGNGHAMSGERERGEDSELDAWERVERPCDGNEGLIRQASGNQKQKTIPKVIVEETYDFPGLSPLKMSGGDAAYAALFDTGHECGGALVSSGLVDDCSLMTGGFCCSTTNWVDERPGDLLPVKPLEGQPQGLPLECVETQKEQTTLEAATSFQEDNERDRDQILHLETELSGSVQGSPGRLVPFSSLEGSPSEQPCHFTTTVEKCSSNLSSDVANGTSIHCKPSSATVLRRSNPKRAASLKSNLADKKPVQSVRTRNILKKSKKAVDINTSVLSGIFNKVKRGRRFSRRPGNLSAWGTAENLINMFVQTNEDARYDDDAIKIQNKVSKSGRSGLGKKKGHTSKKDGRLVVPKTENAASSNSMLTKDQMSLHPYFRVVVNSWPSVTTGVNCQVLEHRTREHTHGAGIKLLEHDRLHVDKDLESTLTHDISVRNLLGEYSGVPSVVGSKAMVETFGDRHLLDPETSPDSDVYHPSMDIGAISSACGTPTNQDGGTDESGLVNEPMMHYSLSTDVSAHSEACIPHTSISQLDIESHNTQKKGTLKKNDEISGCLHSLSERASYTQVSNGRGNMDKTAKALNYKREEWRKQENSNENSIFCSKYNGETTRKGSNCNNFELKSSLPGSGETECFEDPTKMEHGLQNLALSGHDVGNAQSEAETLSCSLLTDLVIECKSPRGTKAGLRESGSGCPESPRHMRRNVHGRKKEKVHKPGRKGKTKEKSRAHDACMNTGRGMSSEIACKPALTESAESSSKMIEGNKAVPVGVSSSVTTPIADEKLPEGSHHGLEVQPSRPKAAWALCDDCHKWRCIPAELVDAIGEADCKWTCKDNVDKAFADCSIPQEKTDAEINAELEISDASGGEDCSRTQRSLKPIESASQPASWTVIKSNLFLHRNRKTQTIDEIMVCHCTPPSNGSLGCGEECLNRMLNIECVKGTCPCGDLCSNQRFQKRKYTKLKSFRCGKKGFGLQLQEEDVSHGRFLIEYVGEVLDLTAYEARQRYYASRGQKHFYFMTLNGGEVIDACAKGNLGRFINHSCDPNCRTEKWMVNGEVCIGLFAIRDIKKGEEVTFDYNYVRVFGAAAKRCVCGSAECRGYLGSDPLNAEAIVQGDSDEEYPEPVMIRGDGGRDVKVDRDISDAIDAKFVKHEHDLIQEENLSSHCPASMIDSEIGLHNEDTTPEPLSDDHHVHNALQSLDPIQTQDSIGRPLPDAEAPDNSLHSSNDMQIEEILPKPISDGQLEVSAETLITINESLPGSPLCDKMLSNRVQDKPITSKPRPITKSSHSKIKKARCSAKNLVPRKAKKLLISSNSGHSEGVEEKLNELLDEEGGISKRKDATKGYLKLLFVTAAEGDNIRGFASQSTRDLSLILDALLKTKSRMVLVDIVNKNGLQMLHNIMKQNRNNFNRIPIIRKLLKVLEFLALKEILTLDHINKSPPCSGMESFKESILILTRHQDMQVHQIARNFRNKWMPRSNRRVEPSNRGDDQLNSQCSHCSRFQSSFKCRHVQRTKNSDVNVSETVHPLTPSCEDLPGEMFSTPMQRVLTSVPLTCYNSTNETRIRKRKSRWDHPSDSMSPGPRSLWSIEDETVERNSKFMKDTSTQLKQTSELEFVKMKHRTYTGETSSCDEAANGMHLDDDAPPGFGSPRKDHHPQFPSACAADLDTTHYPQKNDEVPPGFGSPPKDSYFQIASDTLMVEGDVILGRPQERYISHLTVSYGMPVDLMQELGSPASEGGNHCQPHWATAPGMPFHPFPPLPSYPRGTANPTGVVPRSSAHNVTVNRIKGEAKLDKQCHAGRHPEVTVPSTSAERSVHAETGARNSHITGRERWPSNGPGRRFFHSNRGNNQRFNRCWPPWRREGNNNRFRGSTRNGASSSSDGFCVPGNVSNDNARSNYHQLRHRN